VGQRRPKEVIHYSDQGSQYTFPAFGKRCKEAGMRPSPPRPPGRVPSRDRIIRLLADDGLGRRRVLPRDGPVLAAMLRGDPDLILDSCSVRAKRGGDLTGPNPTDRGKRGTKYHLAVAGDGVTVACATTGANVNCTVLFERLFLMAIAVVANIGTVFADKGYDAEGNREICRAFGAEPCMHKRGRAPGSGLGKRRRPVERSNAWLLENKPRRCGTTARASSSLLQAACLFLVAGRLAREL
jgi:transposase InsO family protein